MMLPVNAEVFEILSYVCNSFYSYRKTVHQFYLQLRQDILNGQLYCHEEASFVLGGLALQAETGDYNEALGYEYFLPEHYIPSKVKLFSLLALIFVITSCSYSKSTCKVIYQVSK